jgi:hypothetical protein
MLVCSGFEDPSLSEWSRTLAQGGAARRTTSHAHAGSGALEVQTSGTGGMAVVVADGLLPHASQELHVRAYAYVPKSEAMIAQALVTVADAALTSGISLLTKGGRFALLAQAGEIEQSTKLAVPTDTWFCLELDLLLGEGDGSVALTIDGVESGVVPKIDRVAPTGVTHVALGSVVADPQSSQLWIDDVAIDTKPVGCE